MKRDKMSMRTERHTRISKRDCDRVLSGLAPEGEGLERLVAAVRVLDSVGDSAPPEETVQRFAAQAARAASDGAREAVSPDALHRGSARSGAMVGAARARKRRLRPVMVAAAAAVILVISSSAGVAYAADGAVPGDTLYGLDLALEKVGIGNGGLGERLNEAGELVSRGRAQEGLELAGKSIAEAGSGDPTLLAAAERLRLVAETASGNQDLDSPDLLRQLAEKLRSMAAGDKSSGELERAARDLADSLQQGGAPVDSDDSSGPGQDSGQGQNGDSGGGAGAGGGDGQNSGDGDGSPGSDPEQNTPGSSEEPAGSGTTSTSHVPNGSGQSR